MLDFVGMLTGGEVVTPEPVVVVECAAVVVDGSDGGDPLGLLGGGPPDASLQSFEDVSRGDVAYIGAGLFFETGLQPGRYLPGVSTFSLNVVFNGHELVGPPALNDGQLPMSSLPYSPWGQLLMSSGIAPSSQPLKKSKCHPYPVGSPIASVKVLGLNLPTMAWTLNWFSAKM